MANLPVEKGTITLQGREIEVRTCMAPQADLKFFPENPRIYSIVHGSTATPHQKDIEKRLKELEHVKQLVQAIKANGGLIDPLIVREGDNWRFRPKPATDSDSNRPPIPEQIGHLFRSKSAGHSGPNRPPL